MTDDAATDLSVDLTEEGDLTILTVRGELDAYSAPTLDAAFDLVAIGAHRRARPHGGRLHRLLRPALDDQGPQAGRRREALRIRNLQPATVRLLDITGLTDHFPLA